MQITIDTKKDDREEIKKVISLLSTLVENQKYSRTSSNIFESSGNSLDIAGSKSSPETENEPAQPNSQPVSGNAFSNMFGNSGTENEVKKDKEEDKITFPDPEKKEKEGDDIGEIQVY